MSSATETRAAASLLILLLAVATAGGGGTHAATALDLRDLLDRAEKSIRRARDAAAGRDPGRVSLLLVRADEDLQRFEQGSGIAGVQGSLQAAGEEARSGNLAGAAAAIERVRSLLPPLYDYIVVRGAEVAGRTALGAAREGDTAEFLRSHAALEAAVLAPTLRGRLDEARRAIARARAAMVRRDMKAGAPEIAEALRAIEGLRYTGALSRASFALILGSELLRENALIAAQDQARRGLREIRQAADWAGEANRATLESLQEEATVLWRRMTRPQDGDADLLAGVAERLDDLRRGAGAR